MKKYSAALLLPISFVIILFSCKKINEATTLGGDLIPPVDNVNTFDTTLDVTTINGRFDDSVRVGYTDPIALGDVNDPEFGNVHANFAFSLSSPGVAGVYPFIFKKDSIHVIDSVVLSLAYTGAYGDTLGNGTQTIDVQEISPSAGFRSDTSYRYKDPLSDFSGTSLGTKTYTIRNLKDTQYIKEPSDTGASQYTKYTNVVRVRLNNSLGSKIANFDTTTGGSNSGFRSDSMFKVLFPGLAVRAVSGGNSLAYFNLADQANTKLTIYYKYKNPRGVDTTASLSFAHSTFGQANYVNVTPGGNWSSAIAGAPTNKVYLESSPSGAFASIIIPGLDAFPNKVIHRAEIIASQVPSVLDQTFTPPSRLFLVRNNKPSPDTTFIFHKDISTSSLDNSLDLSTFGGTLSYGTYKFNITRYVQSIVTTHAPNDTLKIYSPFYTFAYNPAYFVPGATQVGGYQPISIQNRIMSGRVVLGGSNYPVSTQRLRLRIIYSNL